MEKLHKHNLHTRCACFVSMTFGKASQVHHLALRRLDSLRMNRESRDLEASNCDVGLLPLDPPPDLQCCNANNNPMSKLTNFSGTPLSKTNSIRHREAHPSQAKSQGAHTVSLDRVEAPLFWLTNSCTLDWFCLAAFFQTTLPSGGLRGVIGNLNAQVFELRDLLNSQEVCLWKNRASCTVELQGSEIHQTLTFLLSRDLTLWKESFAVSSPVA